MTNIDDLRLSDMIIGGGITNRAVVDAQCAVADDA
jgi:hypothetical protein